MCFSVTVLTFKACVIVVMNNIRWEQSSGEVGNFIGFVANLLQHLCAKNYPNIM